MRKLFTFLFAAVLTASAQLIPSTAVECATSVDGSVVGTPNPLQPVQLAVVYTGSLGSGTYYVEEAWYDAAGHVTLVGPESQIQLVATGEIQENPPLSGIPATVVGRNIYIGATSGSETLQGTATGSSTFYQSVPLVSGAVVPSVNNTVCQIIANDAGWPTGTGYNVSFTTPAGATLPGSPMQWQLLGPGNTINIGQGFPFYNGVVNYPVPLLSRPYGHGPQSVSGPLSMTGYNITQVGLLGIGTQVPGWGVDAEGLGNAGAINSQSGYLFAGAAPLNHVLLGNGTYYVDSATIPYSIITGGPSLTTYYQTVALNGTAQTQRTTLNFSTVFTATDSASPAETTIGLANTGVTANTYAYPTSITVNGPGQITAITAGVAPLGAQYSFTNRNLASNVSVSSNTTTTVDSVTLSALPSGCGTNGCRVRISYSYFIDGGVNGVCWVTDGTTNSRGSQGSVISNNDAYCQDNLVFPAQYSSGATPTISIKVNDTGAATVCAASNTGSPCNNGNTNVSLVSNMQLEVIASN